MNKRPSKENFTALLVHLFTATGAVFAMLAMLAAAEEKWSLMFLWLVVATTNHKNIRLHFSSAAASIANMAKTAPVAVKR